MQYSAYSGLVIRVGTDEDPVAADLAGYHPPPMSEDALEGELPDGLEAELYTACLESHAPNRLGFDLKRIMRTRYRIDTYQKTYFVIDSYRQLMDATAPDFTPYYAQLAQQEFIPAGTVLPSDFVYNRGTGEGWAKVGDV